MRIAKTRTAVAIVATMTLLADAAIAQHQDEPKPTRSESAPPTAPPSPTKNPPAPTHVPLPQFSPLDAWSHVKRGNERAAAARTAREPLPAPAPRPAGAGRHICAVVVCADCDLDVAALLGLPRQDLLLISTPGPFMTPEITALLERAVAEDRLSLVLLLTHTHCTTLDTATTASPQQDALAQRLALVRAEAERTRTTVDKALLLGQRERLLAASDPLQRAANTDTLRVMPGQIDTRSGAITWLHRAADAMPLHPVR